MISGSLAEFEELLAGYGGVAPGCFVSMGAHDVGVGPFTRNKNGVARARSAERCAYCLSPIHHNDGRSLHPRRHLLDNLPRIFVVRVLIGEDNLIARLFSDLTHFGALPCVASAAGIPKYTNFTPIRKRFVERAERIRSMGVINHHHKILTCLNPLDSSGD